MAIWKTCEQSTAAAVRVSRYYAIAEAYRIGGRAFVPKNAAPTVLADAIKKAHAGEVYFLPKIAERLALIGLKADESPQSRLEPRELEVFRMMALDTHVLVWWLTESPGLSTAAKRAIRRHSGPAEIAVSAITVLEITTAARRGRLQFTVPVEQWLADMRCIPQLRLEPVSADTAALAGSFVDPMHGDPADRIIVATATVLGVPLVTADERLRSLPALTTIW